jgi:nitrate/nitrite transporter NarK
MDFLRGYAAFLDYRYWLNPSPVPLGPSLVSGILSFFAWFLIAAIVLRLAAHGLRKKDALRAEILRRFARILSTTGLLGLLFLFFTYEQLPLFGMRLWFLLLFALFLVWLGRFVAYAVREYPQKRHQLDERRQLEKYLPKKK